MTNTSNVVGMEDIQSLDDSLLLSNPTVTLTRKEYGCFFIAQATCLGECSPSSTTSFQMALIPEISVSLYALTSIHHSFTCKKPSLCDTLT